MASYLPDGVEDSLETRLNKATNPLQVEENWEYIVGFCDLINKDIDGPQTAIRLLVHKIQSPQEKEALFALTTLEACVRNCGQRFQQEIGKFRFINEIIKIVSPKYLGSLRTTKVKNRCIALLHFWSQILTDEPKIKEAYIMLKKQGIVKEDPDIYQLPAPGLHSSGMTNYQQQPPPPPPPKNSIFDDEEKSKLLSRLLKSKNPEDLQSANRLIKNMVKQDAERTEKVTRRTQQLETVSNNVKLLNEMLQNYQPGNSTESDREIMKELSENIEKQRPALFRLASDSDERDSTGIGEILRANDEVIQVLSLYDSLINKSDVGNLLAIEDADGGLNVTATTSKNISQIDALMKNVGKELNNFDALTSPLDNHGDTTLLDEQLLFLGLKDQTPSTPPTDECAQQNAEVTNNIGKSGIDELSDIFSLTTNSHPPLIGNPTFPSEPFQSSSILPNYFVATSSLMSSMSSGPTSTNLTKPLSGVVTSASSNTTSLSSFGLESLNELSKSLLKETLTSSGLKPFQPVQNPTKVTLSQMGKTQALINNNAISIKNNAKSLDDIFVPLETIRPGSKPSKSIYCENDVSIVSHFASERPRSDVEVVATTITSTSRFPIKDFLLHVNPMDGDNQVLVKMQPASSSSLPAYNPILPPSAITQVLLISHPTTDINVKLKMEISYSLNDVLIKKSINIDL